MSAASASSSTQHAHAGAAAAATATPKPFQLSLFDRSAYVAHVLSVHFLDPIPGSEPESAEAFGTQRQVTPLEIDEMKMRMAKRMSRHDKGNVLQHRPVVLVMQYSESTGFVRDLLLESGKQVCRAMITKESTLAKRSAQDLAQRLTRLDAGYARAKTLLAEETPAAEATLTSQLALIPDRGTEASSFFPREGAHFLVMVANFGSEQAQREWFKTIENANVASVTRSSSSAQQEGAAAAAAGAGADAPKRDPNQRPQVQMKLQQWAQMWETTYTSRATGDYLPQMASMALQEFKELLLLLNRPEELLAKAGEVFTRGWLALAGGLNVYKDKGCATTFQNIVRLEQQLEKQRNEINAKIEPQIQALPARKNPLNEKLQALHKKQRHLQQEIREKRQGLYNALIRAKTEHLVALMHLQPQAVKKLKEELIAPFETALAQVDPKKELEYSVAQSELSKAQARFNEEAIKYLLDPKRARTEEEIRLQESVQQVDQKIAKVMDSQHNELQPLMQQSNQLNKQLEDLYKEMEALDQQMDQEREALENLRVPHLTLLLLPENYRPSSEKLAPEEYRNLLKQNPLAQTAFTMSREGNRAAFMAHFGGQYHLLQTGKGARYAIVIPVNQTVSFDLKDLPGFAPLVNTFIAGKPDLTDPLLQPALQFLDRVRYQTIEETQAQLNGLIDQKLLEFVVFHFAHSDEAMFGVKSKSEAPQKAILKAWIEEYRQKFGGQEPPVALQTKQLLLEWTRRIENYYSEAAVTARYDAVKPPNPNDALSLRTRRAHIFNETQKGKTIIQEQVGPILNVVEMVNAFRESLLYTLVAGIKEFTGRTTPPSHFHQPFHTHMVGGAIEAVNKLAGGILKTVFEKGQFRPFEVVKQAISAFNVAMVTMRKQFEGQK